LPLLTVPVTALLARPVSLGEGSHFLVEPAAPLFGLRDEKMPARGPGSAAGAPARESQLTVEEPAWERVSATDLPAWGKLPAFAERRSLDRPFEDRDPDDLHGETVLEEAERTARERLDDFTSIEGSAVSALTPADRELFTETLTIEEMEEFERFEQQRRGGDGGAE